MVRSLVHLPRIVFREREAMLKPGARELATLGLKKVRPGKAEADVKNWLMTMGFVPTSDDTQWKAEERFLTRLPKGSIMKAQKL